MANPQEKSTPAAVSETSLLKDEDYVEEYEEAGGVEFCGCGCFQGVFCFRLRRDSNGTHRYLLQQQDQEIRESWLKKRVKKLKEISEVMAGPKWKTFIRRFSVNKKKCSKPQFQYDPESYKLNFDDGINGEIDGLDFSARYAGAAPVGIGRGELGRDPAGF